MATKEGTWRTWAGSRSDITRAAREAADALTEWTGYPALMSGTVTYENDLSEPLVGLDAVDDLYASDLPGVKSLWIEVHADREAFYAEQARLRGEWRAERERLWEQHYAERTRLIEVWEQAAQDRIERGEDPGQPDELAEPEMPQEPELEPLIAASVLLRVP